MAALINAFLYWITLLFYKSKYKGIDVYTVLLLIYAITATICTITAYQEPKKYGSVPLGGLLFVFVVFIIMVAAFRGFDISKKNIKITDSTILKALIGIYIVCALFTIITSFQDVFFRIQENAWNSIRNEVYTNEGELELYSSPLQRITKNIGAYFSPLAVVYAFYLLTEKKVKLWLIFLLFSSIIIPGFMAATVVASRGMIMNIVIKMAFGYIIFYNAIPKRRRKYIYLFASAVLLLLLIYIIAVSISRFGEDEYQSSMFFYFGHSMLSFSQNVFGKLHDYLYGEYFFYWFLNDNGNVTSMDFSVLGSTHGTSFITFVGPLYADFGFLGTLLFAFVSYLLFRNYTKKKTIQLSDLVMLFFYMTYLGTGIFCPGTSGALRLLMVSLLCVIIRVGEFKYKTK